ncbi:MAG TPA: class I SAM-dependent methyltransferase [Longimicrobiales bacterium]|nr:class I SAM-dependent methyltransferase [Longimicrobiales bacterium]
MQEQQAVRLYDAQYGQFASDLYAQIRTDAFGEDIGQNGWLTADEHDLFIQWLDPDPASHLLDVASGSGGTTLRIARLTGCKVQGIDIHPEGVSAANEAARMQNLSGRASFEVGDASKPLRFADASFDGLICIDAVNHLPERRSVFAEWARLLAPGGRLVFTDPIVVTGALTNVEIAIRASIGFFLFVPPGLDEELLRDTGFEPTDVVDRTENMAKSAQQWHDARAARADDLRRIEGEETFAGQQKFLDVAARLAAERRLSRIAYRAIRS